MKNKKRFLSLLLALAITATMAPWPAMNASASFTGAFQFNQNGTFTVMQLTDIQVGSSVNSRIVNMITSNIARYHPDLVLFTGDNIAGSISSSTFQSDVNQYLAPLLATGTKFAVTFGNHDNDKSIVGTNAGTLQEQYNYFKSRGGSYFVDHDVAALDGVGSGVIPIYPYGQSSGTPAYQVYLMDSNDTAASGTYDCPYTSQIDYYIQRSQTYPTVPSLWFQHIIVPEIYTKASVQVSYGTVNSYTGIGSPYSSSTWTLNPSLINWPRSSSALLSDIYREAPCPADQTLYESAAHRSSAAYGSKTLYEAWNSYGNLKGAYFGHEHLNECTVTTSDGIDLGYGESSGLVAGYKDDNAGASIYVLRTDGSYSNVFSAETDLAKVVVSFDPNGGTGTMSSQLFTKNTTAALNLNTYTNPGYTFAGWATTADGAAAYADGASFTAGTADVVLYAKWANANTISITFNANGGTGTMNNQIITKNSTAALNLNTYTKQGYTFAGWSTSAGGTVEYTDGANFTAGTADVVLYAKWEKINISITFNANGGTGTMNSQSIPINSTAALNLNTYTYAGYAFAGWAMTAGGSVAYTDGANFTAGTADIVLYAKWEKINISITFNANGGTGTMSSQSIPINSTAALNLNTYTRQGYTFTGWSTSAGGAVEYADGANFTAGTADVVLYAKWVNNYITITFSANGGTGTMNSQSILKNSTAALNLNTYTKQGYTFAGWSTTAGGTVEYADGANFTAGTADVVLYAKWVYNYISITFNANGGTGTMNSQPILKNSTAALNLNTYTYAGYAFAGWATTAGGTVAYADGANFTAGTVDVVLYAKWIKKTAITFDANGGNGGTGPTLMVPGTSLTAPVVTRTGYTFTGWVPAVPSVVPSVDTVYVAQWGLNSYTVTFDANGGTGSANPVTQGFNTNVPLPTSGLSKTGYTFIGWNTSPGASTAITSYTMPAYNSTLYAIYTVNRYTVHFDANGGTGSVPDIAQDYGTEVTLPSSGFYKTGYTFIGWNTDPNAATALASYTIPAGNSTLYAVYTINRYTVTFDPGIGTGPDPALVITQDYGTTVDFPTSGYAKTGYTFLGWNTDPDATSVIAGFCIPASDSTLYAIYSINQYVIYFDPNGGDGGDIRYKQEYNSYIMLPELGYAKTGYTFIGWNTTPDATTVLSYCVMPASDFTLYAVYSINQYTVKFDANGGTGGYMLTLNFGEPLTPPVVTRTGYDFTGWSPAVPNTVPAYSKIYKAQWVLHYYTIIFDANGGTGGTSLLLSYDSELQAPAVTRQGYTFTGWSPAVPAMSPAADATYTAQWVKTIYTVTFSLNGGTGTVPTAQQGFSGTAVTIPPQGNITNTGYYFLGWAETPDAKTALSSYAIPEKNVTLYAVWAFMPITIYASSNSTAVLDPVNHVIYGLKEGLYKNQFESKYVTVTGKGKLEYSTTSYILGTGTVITLKNSVTGEVIQTYTVVIFGDLNGDGNIDAADADTCILVQNWTIRWDRTNQKYLYMAGDINKDGNVDSIDADLISNTTNWYMYIDQTTGRAILY